MKDKNKTLSITCAFLLGIVLGFLLAPIKKGISIDIKNNGNCNPGVSE